MKVVILSIACLKLKLKSIGIGIFNSFFRRKVVPVALHSTNLESKMSRCVNFLRFPHVRDVHSHNRKKGWKKPNLHL